MNNENNIVDLITKDRLSVEGYVEVKEGRSYVGIIFYTETTPGLEEKME